MKFSFLPVFAISFLVSSAGAHSFQDVTNNSKEEENYLRGSNLDKAVAGTAVKIGHLQNDLIAASLKSNYCTIKYVEPDGTIICRKRRNKNTEIIVDECLRNEELVIDSNGRAHCRKIKHTEIVVDHCLSNEELVIDSNGRARCRKISGRVVRKKGPRKNRKKNKAVIYEDDDLIRVVKRRNKDKVVVYDDDDVVRIVGRRNGRDRVVIVDDDDVFRRREVVPVSPVAPVSGGTIALGGDCTNARTLCVAGLTCAPSPLVGSDRWVCQ